MPEESMPDLNRGSPHGQRENPFVSSPERRWMRFSRLAMPLAPDDVTVNMLLVALVPTR